MWLFFPIKWLWLIHVDLKGLHKFNDIEKDAFDNYHPGTVLFPTLGRLLGQSTSFLSQVILDAAYVRAYVYVYAWTSVCSKCCTTSCLASLVCWQKTTSNLPQPFWLKMKQQVLPYKSLARSFARSPHDSAYCTDGKATSCYMSCKLRTRPFRTFRRSAKLLKHA